MKSAREASDGSIRFWDLKTSRPVVVEHTGWVERLAFRRDGLRVLSERDFDGAKPTKGWNPFTGELDTALAGITFEKLPDEFMPGSGYYKRQPRAPTASSSRSRAMPAWHASRSREYSISSVVVREKASGEIVHTLTGHSADVVSVVFSPDSRRLATASFDRTMKLWDMQTGQDVFTLRGHTAGVVSLAFSPDGNQIVTGRIDSTARVWNATPLASNVIAEHDARYRGRSRRWSN